VICLPTVLALSDVAEESTTKGEPSGQRGKFSDFRHLKTVFHCWIATQMFLCAIHTSSSILVKLTDFNR